MPRCSLRIPNHAKAFLHAIHLLACLQATTQGGGGGGDDGAEGSAAARAFVPECLLDSSGLPAYHPACLPACLPTGDHTGRRWWMVGGLCCSAAGLFTAACGAGFNGALLLGVPTVPAALASGATDQHVSVTRLCECVLQRWQAV